MAESKIIKFFDLHHRSSNEPDNSHSFNAKFGNSEIPYLVWRLTFERLLVVVINNLSLIHTYYLSFHIPVRFLTQQIVMGNKKKSCLYMSDDWMNDFLSLCAVYYLYWSAINWKFFVRKCAKISNLQKKVKNQITP